MQLRWVVIPVLFMFSVVGVYNVCHDAGGPVDTIVGMARRITFGALFAVGFWTASHLLQRWMSQTVAPQRTAAPSIAPPPPLPTFMKAPVPVGPGQYRVSGTDSESHFQTSEVIFADSPSNAQLKVELKGVRVAAVERAG
jgi:hypothetical protein